MHKKNKYLCYLMSIILIAGSIVSNKIIAKASTISNRDIEISLAADALSNNLELNGFSDKLKNELNAKYGISPDKVHIKTTNSSTASANGFNWQKVDHTNVSANAVSDNNNLVNYYNDTYYDPNWQQDNYVDGWALNQPYHIRTSSDGSSITFDGYGSPAYKDFLYTSNSTADNKIFSFQIDEANVQYHSADGSGFLFGADYKSNNGTRTLSGYAVLIGQNNVGLYELKGVDVNQFTNESSFSFFNSLRTSGTSVSKWGGNVTCLSITAKPAPSSGTVRYLKLVASPTAVSFYQFSDASYATTSSNGAIFTNAALPEVFSGFGFGPIASYASHSCSRGTESVFSNIKVTEDDSIGFSDLVRSTAWQYDNSLKLVVNVDNDGVSEFSDTAKLSSILYYMMKNNAHYVGWGINNSINLGGYNTVMDQADGFISRNEGKGTFINRSDSSYSSLDQGVDALANYIYQQLGGLKDISKPNLTTTFNGNNNVTCKTNDTVTSNGNPIGAYKWKTLDIASGTWLEQPETSNAEAITFPQNTYNIIGLSVQDSVTNQWSDYTYSYVATVASVEAISQFSLDKNYLMPNCPIAALKTGTVVTASDSSYEPNGTAITDHEWTVLDSALKPVTALAKEYTSSNIPSGVQFDFASQPAGTYTIRLRNKNSSGTWSPYYEQQITVYSEGSSVSILTTNSTSGLNVYQGTVNVPFTISSTAGNITSYRIITILKDGSNSIGDWIKINASTVNAAQTLNNINGDVYIQAIDAAGNSKTQYVGTYLTQLNIVAKYAGTNDIYNSNAPTNKDITFTTSNPQVEYSVDGGNTFASFTSPMTVSAGGNYIFRYVNDSNKNHYVTIAANINKAFQGVVSGITDQAKYSNAVTPVISKGTATLSKDGSQAEPYTSNTQIIDDGNYTLTVTDEYGNTKAYNFTIDKVNPVISVTGNPTVWTKDNIKLSISTSVGISGLKAVTVSKDGGSETDITNQTSYLVSENGIYVFKAVNGANQAVTTTVVVNKIDKGVPSLKIESINSDNKPYVYSNMVPTEKNVVITLSDINNVISGVKYYYTTDGGISWAAIDKTPFTIDNTNNATVKYKFKAVSGSGIESDISTEIPVYIVKPSFTNDIAVTQSTSEGNLTFGQWTNKQVTLTVSKGINAEAFAKYQYTTTPEDASSWKDMNGVGLNTLTLSDDENSVYYFRVISKGQSSGSETVGIPVRIDKTAPTDLTISFKDNSFKSLVNSISFGLFYNDNIDVNINANFDISGIDHYEYQIVDFSKHQIFDQNGTWEAGASFSIAPQFKGVVYARAVDKAGNISQIVSTDGVVSDNITPTAPIINATTSNGAYIGDWTSSNINITASGSQVLSGINHYEYKFGANGSWQAMSASSGAIDSVSGKLIKDTFTVDENMAASVFVRAVSNSGLVSEASSTLIKRDNGIPQSSVNISGAVNNWTTSPVKFTLSNSNINNIAPVYYFIKVGAADWTELEGNSYTFDREINTQVQFKAVTSAGVENIYPTTYSVKIDRTKPVIAGADNNASYYFGRKLQYSDNSGEIASAVYSKDNGNPINFESGAFLGDAGKYNITVTDKAGNQSSISYTVKALPSPKDITYTNGSKDSIEKLRQEFNNTTSLPGAYGYTMDSAIKTLENEYTDLDNQVKKEIADTAAIVTADDGLIGEKGAIEKTLGDIGKLTEEQQIALKVQVDELNNLLNRINELSKAVEEVKGAIEALPAVKDVKKTDADIIIKTKNSFDALNNEQKKLVGQELTDKLNAVVAELAKLMLYDSPNDVTVTGVDGTSFSPDTYLKVTPLTGGNSSQEITDAQKAIDKAGKSEDSLKDKDLLVLYDVSMLKGNSKIEPNGKVKVKIKIPAKYKQRKQLDIVHIADDGKVTLMKADIEGDYLVFITDHFSKYGIIAKDNCIFGICKAFGIYSNEDGICYDWMFILGAVIVLIAIGGFAFYKTKKKKGETQVQE